MTLNIKQYLQPSILLSAALVLTAFGVSIFFEGYRDIHYAPAAIALLGFACIGIVPAFWKGFQIPSSPAALLVFSLWLYVTLSLSWSSVPFASLVTYLVFMAMPLCFFTPLLAGNRDGLVKTLSMALFIFISIAAGWAVIQFLFLQETYGSRAHHPLPNPNNLAGLINLGFLPALALFMVVKEKSWLFLGSLLLVLIFFAGLIATGSRGGIISAIIAGFILVVTLRHSPPVFWQRILIFIIPAAIICFLLNITGGLSFAVNIGDNSSSLARIAIWQSTWEMVKDHLWLGTGFGTFYLYYAAYRQPGADDSAGNWAHMDPLQYWAEMGIIAPILFYGICIAVLIRTVKAVRALPKDSTERAGIMAMFCGIFAMVLHSHATFNLYIMPILIVTGTWLALWYHLTGKALGNSFTTVAIANWQKPFMGIVTIAIAGLIGVMAVSSAAGQHHLLRAHELIKQGLTTQFTAAIEESEKWAPSSFIDPEIQLAAFYIDLLGVNASALFTLEEQEHLYTETLALLDEAQSQNPPWAEVDYKRGMLYNAANKKTEAIEALKIAVHKNKTHFNARKELASLYIQRGQVEKAYELLGNGLKYPHTASVENDFTEIMQNIEGLVAIKRAYDMDKNK